MVDEVAGTTRDPVDSLVPLGGEVWRFVDTAGLRRRVREAAGAEYYSSLRTETALRSAEVALVLLDASERLSEQDQRILSMAVEAGRAIVIAFNKWDLVDEDRRYDLEREIDRDLSRIQWAPRVNVSARTGRSVDKLATAIRTALAGWETRVSRPGRLNTWLADVVATTPPPSRGGKLPKVLFATQADIAPAAVRRLQLRLPRSGLPALPRAPAARDFGFVGTPIEVSVRVRTSDATRPARPLVRAPTREPGSSRRTRRPRPAAATGSAPERAASAAAKLERRVDRAARSRAPGGARPRIRCASRPLPRRGHRAAVRVLELQRQRQPGVRQIPWDLQQHGDGGCAGRDAGDRPACSEHVQLARRVRLRSVAQDDRCLNR